MNPDHLKILRQGVETWNAWRREEFSVKPYLHEANLHEANLHEANLSRAELGGTDLSNANLSKADLSRADLNQADLCGANLCGANLNRAYLVRADLAATDLSRADLSEATLLGARFVGTDLTGADLTGCRIFGLSAWRLKIDDHTKQQNLIITPFGEPEITIDNIEVAQFVYLLLHNEKIRDVIDTIGKKAVLILGRFTEERKNVLDAIREELRKRDYLPILFDFDKPASKDLTGTVLTLAHMARFIIADLTDPSSIPYEVSKVADAVVPVQPILLSGNREFAMFGDLQRRHHWFLPIYPYQSQEQLIAEISERVI